MSEDLKRLITNIQSSFKADPEEARTTFKTSSTLGEGLRSEVTIREHGLTVDEPDELGGTNAGPNPVELVLAALGTCQEITYRAYAAALDIPLDSVSVELDGHIDLRGFFAVDDSVRPGYEAIKGTVRIVSRASESDLQRLRDAVNAHCPVLDILTKPVPVELELQTRPTAEAAA